MKKHVLFFLFTIYCNTLIACDCFDSSSEFTINYDIEHADFIIYGYVNSTSKNGYKASIHVEKTYKGTISEGEILDIDPGKYISNCHYSFTEGSQILLYAYINKDGAIDISICSATISSNRSDFDARYKKQLVYLNKAFGDEQE